MSTKLTNYELPKDAYLNFDAQNLKEELIKKLSQSGVFTDQIYEGSNMSAVLDVIAYVYHLLLFYLNRTSTESTFTQTQLYENMNRIVKLLNYKPIGYQTPCVAFQATATEQSSDKVGLISATTYTLPRFAYLNVNGIKYTLTKDIVFALSSNDERTESGQHILDQVSIDNLFFQGDIIEAQPYIAIGDIFETYTLVPANNSIKKQYTIVDFSNFSVFVFDANEQVWREWTETSSLYLESNSALKYEKRLNEQGYYEFRFGNNINGKQLNGGDIVQIYYLKSEGKAGEIGANQLNGNTLNLYKSSRYDAILSNIFDSASRLMDLEEAKCLSFTNDIGSTQFTLPETVDMIRANHGKVFASQSRLITATDIQTHIERNFNNITSSVYVMNNDEYLKDVMAYYYKLGIGSITKDSRIALNQVNFSTSCNFNNVYAFMVPKSIPVNDNNNGQYISSSLKQYIVSQMDAHKPLTCEIVPMDPIYIALGFGLQTTDDTLFSSKYTSQTPDDIVNSTKIVITRYSNSHNKTSAIQSETKGIIKNVFTNTKLGQTFNPTELTNLILQIEGVKSVQTVRNGVAVDGISVMVWNPQHYLNDLIVTTNVVTLENYKYPFFYNLAKVEDYIDVEIE